MKPSPLLVLRPSRARWVVYAITLVLITFNLVTAVTLPGGPIYSYVWRVTVPVCTGLIIAMLLMMARPRLVAYEDRLVITNLIKREVLEWPQVIAVRFAKDAPWASLDLADGRNLPVMALQNSDGQRARAAAVNLADLVADQGARGSA